MALCSMRLLWMKGISRLEVGFFKQLDLPYTEAVLSVCLFRGGFFVILF